MKKRLLYEFYYTIFHSFHKHSDFAKILIKEQMQSFNEEFDFKISHYNDIMEQIILSMVERLYGEEVQDTKYDLMYCIKGFMKTYSELLFISIICHVDLNLLGQSLVEKTNFLAKYTNIPFISNEMVIV